MTQTMVSPQTTFSESNPSESTLKRGRKWTPGEGFLGLKF